MEICRTITCLVEPIDSGNILFRIISFIEKGTISSKRALKEKKNIGL